MHVLIPLILLSASLLPGCGSKGDDSAGGTSDGGTSDGGTSDGGSGDGGTSDGGTSDGGSTGGLTSGDGFAIVYAASTAIGLDGRASCDPEGDSILGYLWVLTSYPGGARTEIERPDSLHASFVAPAPGQYSVTLTVRTADRVSEPDEVAVEVRDDLATDLPPTVPARNLCGDRLD